VAIDSLAPTTELEAVNAILATTGDTPVTALTPGLRADVDFVLNTVRLVSKSVQGKGWLFNTDREVELTPAIDNTITLDDNVMKVTKSLIEDNRDVNYSFRAGKLWDRVNNTDQFSDNAIVDITRALDYEDIPESARTLIFVMAGRRYQQQTLGNTELSGFGKEDEQTAIAALVEAEGLLDNTDYLQNFPDQRTANIVLREVSKEVQSEGWKFNTRLNVAVGPDADGFILLDPEWLTAKQAAISQNNCLDTCQRGLGMYDVKNDTDVFTTSTLPTGTLYLDVVEYLELEDIPPVALKYIKLKAARQLQASRNPQQPQANGYTDQDEIFARRALMHAEGRKESFNMGRNMSVARVTAFRKDNFGRGKLRRGPNSF
jgi:hypothetical protein